MTSGGEVAQRVQRAQSEVSVPVVEVIVSDGLGPNTVARVGALVDEAIGLNPEQLVIEFAGSQIPDDATVSLLVRAHRRMRQIGGIVTLRRPSPRLPMSSRPPVSKR